MHRKIWFYLTFPLAFLITFVGVTYAQAAAEASPDQSSLVDLAKPVWEAVTHGQYWLAASLALVFTVAAFKRYAPGKVGEWSHTDVGGSVLVLLGSFGGAMATALAAGASPMSGAMAYAAMKVALAAAGGFALIKKLVVEPLLKPLAAKAPAWAQPIFALVFWIFDKPALAEAAKAGDAAVAAQPSTGVAGAVGKAPTEIQ